MSLDTRVAALDGLLEEAGLDAVLATKDASIAYLTGFWGVQLERFFGVVVKRGGEGALIAPSLDRESVATAPTALDKTLYSAGVSNGLPELFATLDGAKRIGVEEDHLIFARSKALAEAGYELVPATSLVMHLREAKQADEVAAVRAPAATSRTPTTSSGAAWRSATPRPRPTRASRTCSRAAARQHAEPHILFGTNAALPHGSPGERKLEAGDIVCADISAQFDGYWGDMTRCAHAGSPSDWAGRPGTSCSRPTPRRLR